MRIRHALAVFALLGGAGCFSTPGFSGTRDGGGDDDGGSGSDGGTPGPFVVSVIDGTLTDTETVVIGPNMRLVFANAFGKMPRSLKTKTSMNEWLSDTNSNYEERGIGVSLDDRYIVGYHASITDGQATNFEVLEVGPVRAQIRITWGGPPACTGGANLTGNTTTFSVYPDGRIARHDEITPTSVGSCTKTVGAFHSFDGSNRSFYKYFDANVETSQTAVPTEAAAGNIDTTMMSSGFACLHDSDAAVGTTFTKPNDDAEWTYFESVRALTTDIGFNYMVNEDETLIPNHLYVANTLTALRATTCELLGDEMLLPYASPVTIHNATWQAADGAYHTPTSEVTPMADLKAGAVFVLDNETAVPQLMIRQDSLAEGVDYVAQNAKAGDSGGAILYLKRSLNAGDVLTIGGN